jgi:hypothetical protein
MNLCYWRVEWCAARKHQVYGTDKICHDGSLTEEVLRTHMILYLDLINRVPSTCEKVH